jgi:hypothetical protein
VYASLAKAILDGGEPARAASRVERLRRRHPRASRDEIADRLIRRTALECAGAGALLTGPAAFFGASPFGAGLVYQAAALNRLVLALSELYGADDEGLGGRAAAGVAGAAAAFSAEVLRQGLVRLLRELLPRRTSARGAAGALAGAALGYGAALAVGGFAGEQLRRSRRLLPSFR